ncbi:MAG: nucleotidyltransferase family protein [Lachnospiraceae bacterium]|nr:nucleotidyltransferase family protein [Lachnospiraceae bacterium]
MKTVGIITEFNPFHKGHRYIISKAKEVTGADFCIIITSGSFVQRGEPSFIDKYTKTTIALRNGADLVIELPIPFSCASAEYFATCAVTLLNNLNIVDFLAFGVEANNLDVLNKVADILIEEPDEYKKLLKLNLSCGYNFVSSRSKSLSALLPDIDLSFINGPNNILGLEYIKALKKLNSPITPVCISRINAGYHDVFDDTPSANDDFTSDTYISDTSCNNINNRLYSASNLRNLEDKQLVSLLADIDTAYEYNYAKTYPVRLNNSFSAVAGTLILSAINNSNNIYFDVPDYLFDKIKNNFSRYTCYSDFILSLKSKDISYTSISRALLHIVLNITTELVNNMIADNYGNYIRILGFKKDSTILFKNIKNNSDIKLITNVKNYSNDLNGNALKYFEHSLKAEDIYRLCQTMDLKSVIKNEYEQKFLTL